MAKEVVRVVRAFGGAPIRVVVTGQELAVEMELEDFIRELSSRASERLAKGIADAAGSPALLMTSAQLQRRLVESVEPADVSLALSESAFEVVKVLKKASVVAQ